MHRSLRYAGTTTADGTVVAQECFYWRKQDSKNPKTKAENQTALY